MTIQRLVTLSVFLLFVFIPKSHGYGTDWEFTVVELTPQKKSRYLIKLRPVSQGESFPLYCEELVIDSRFKPKRWSRRKPSFLNKSAHKDALAFLKLAKEAELPIRFGITGSGFGRAHGADDCEVKSRGLYLMDEVVVYSYFKWP